MQVTKQNIHPTLEFNRLEVNVPFEIHTMEWIEQNRKEQNAIPHRHNYFTIIWVRHGKGEHLLDLEKIAIEDGSVYFISPGSVHLLTIDGEVDGYVISFTPDFLPSFYPYGYAQVIKVDKEVEADMEEAVAKMMREFSNYYLLRSEILGGFLQIFLIYLTRNFESNPAAHNQPRNYETVKAFLTLIDQHYTRLRQVSDYAKELVVTPNYLNELVKKITGHPASYHIQQRIILEAKRLVRYSNHSLKEIAYELGFEDAAHFSKYFKKASGQNFSDYKRQL
ncbi:AraC family transcriptional regulator [Flavihumibacter sp. ZG627]|uniref:helix-turn-helix domain-containing protein n=1 Tax=Flavihumibacter sp. ZG627 TaxID=1463156 RepID=UPI00057E3712|nr:helix-turn-helix transcriptional regulator [Flavihumibacter sp. ZG627]KIC91675.1 AraC family transcriptional regulator [Flavihumibacter sp. ZG627]